MPESHRLKWLRYTNDSMPYSHSLFAVVASTACIPTPVCLIRTRSSGYGIRTPYSQVRVDPLEVLPAELALRMCGLLPAETLAILANVSLAWRRLVGDASLLWRTASFDVSDAAGRAVFLRAFALGARSVAEIKIYGSDYKEQVPKEVQEALLQMKVSAGSPGCGKNKVPVIRRRRVYMVEAEISQEPRNLPSPRNPEEKAEKVDDFAWW